MGPILLSKPMRSSSYCIANVPVHGVVPPRMTPGPTTDVHIPLIHCGEPAFTVPTQQKLASLPVSFSPDKPLSFPFFTFRNSRLLDSLSQYLLPWKMPRIEQFHRNSTMRYAKRIAGRIQVSSSATCDGDHEFFHGHVTLGGIGSFRLRNSKDWSTFDEYVHARAAVEQYLQSSEMCDCTIDESLESGFIVLPPDPKRFCRACGNTLFVGVSCPNNSESIAVSVQLMEYYRTGDIDTTGTKYSGMTTDSSNEARGFSCD